MKAFDQLADRTASRAIQLQTQSRRMSVDDGSYTQTLKENYFDKDKNKVDQQKDSDENDTQFHSLKEQLFGGRS